MVRVLYKEQNPHREVFNRLIVLADLQSPSPAYRVPSEEMDHRSPSFQSRMASDCHPSLVSFFETDKSSVWVKPPIILRLIRNA